jgi:hypothetical protein
VLSLWFSRSTTPEGVCSFVDCFECGACCYSSGRLQGCRRDTCPAGQLPKVCSTTTYGIICCYHVTHALDAGWEYLCF